MKVRQLPHGRLIAALTAVLALVAVPLSATSASADPPGNNGTIKVDGIPFDDHRDNEPHVGCVFQVDFYNYDDGVGPAKVTFKVQPPSSKNFSTLPTFPQFVDIGEDLADGTIDAQQTYDLSGLLNAFLEHPNQGFHIKLTINAPGSIGADTKHKTFWVQQCAYTGVVRE